MLTVVRAERNSARLPERMSMTIISCSCSQRLSPRRGSSRPRTHEPQTSGREIIETCTPQIPYLIAVFVRPYTYTSDVSLLTRGSKFKISPWRDERDSEPLVRSSSVKPKGRPLRRGPISRSTRMAKWRRVIHNHTRRVQ